MPSRPFPEIQVLPSILSADFCRLGDQIREVEQAGMKMLHVDVMDGHFVPNLTLGPPVVSSIRKHTRMILDVHLMITDPDTYVPLFIEAGADQVSVHQEAATHLDRTIRSIQDLGAKAGVVLNPATPVGALEEILPVVDFVLLMSVNPGFGGQKLLPYVFEKARRLAARRADAGLHFAIEIDGGITAANVQAAVEAGCDWLVAGSSVFGAADPGAGAAELYALARSARYPRA